MIDTIKQILKKLEEKKTLFRAFEKETKVALEGDTAALETALNNRAKIVTQINAKDAEIEKLLKSADENSHKLTVALKNSCNRSELFAEYLEVFDSAQELFTLVSHITDMDKEISAVILAQKKVIEENIKKINKSPKIAKFIDNFIGDAGTMLERKF